MHVDPEIGSHFKISVDDSDMDFIITRVNDEEVELDGNHPLAGKNLSFEIEIVKIKLPRY